MNKIIIIPIIFFFIQYATALNDINISIDPGSVTLCLAEKTLTNMTCNTTSVLTLDGSKDHYLYFTSEKLYETLDRDTENKWDWVSDNFFILINLVIDIMYFFLPFFIYLGGGLLAIFIVRYFITGHF